MGSAISPARLQMERRMRFNPLTYLTPQKLTQQLDQFEQGYLWEIGRTWDAIARRDDKLPALIGKRLGALARYGWEILAPEDDAEAQAHKAALEYTFNHLTAVNAVDENEQGGMSLALRMIGSAIAHRYAAAELLWTPVIDEGGPQLQCELRHVPLWFFENTTGRLRFTETPGGTVDGQPLEDGAWLVACGAGLMHACSVLYMFKRLPHADWLNYCEAYGLPGVVGHTTAAPDSAAGQAMASAVAAIGAQLAFTLYGSTKNEIEFLRPDGSGQLPFPELIERCDRGLSILWRGADLSTMSAGSGSGEGASLQGNESDLLEQDDAAWASEILQNQIARRVIAWKFGAGVTPKAYIRIKTKQTPDTALDLQVCQVAVGYGLPISRKWFSERFGIPLAKDEDELLTTASTAGTAEPGTGRADRITESAGDTEEDDFTDEDEDGVEDLRRVHSANSFDPNQPRDEFGMWTGGEAGSARKARSKMTISTAAGLLQEEGFELGRGEFADGKMSYSLKSKKSGEVLKKSAQEIMDFLVTRKGKAKVKSEERKDRNAENDAAAVAAQRKGLKTFLDKSRAHAARAIAKDLQPLREAIAAIVEAPDAELAGRLAAFRANGASLFKAIAEGGHTERALAEILAPALLDGAATPKT